MSPLHRYVAGSVAIFAVAATVTSVFYINFCGTVFQCGCQSLWSTAALHCNIHAPAGKHCPWCSFGRAGYAAVYGPMLASQALLSFVPRRWGWLERLTAALAAFPTVGGVLAVLFGLLVGYWN
jgi:hypothetical protein